MKVEIEVNLTENDKKRLKSIFTYLNNYNETEIIEGILLAAKNEYLDQFLKDGNRSTVGEIRQHKLFLLVQDVYKGRIPSEVEVASIFKIPISGAKTLIRNMRSRYQFEIEDYLKKTINDILDQIDEDKVEDGYFHFYIRSSFMYGEMNQIIELKDQNCEKIKKYNNISSLYKISIESKQLLENYINE